MISPVKLPPLPDMDIGVNGQVKFAYSAETLKAYAEQAVREALAAQEPVAYLRADSLVRLAHPHVAGLATALEKRPRDGFVPIVIIPEKDHGEPS